MITTENLYQQRVKNDAEMFCELKKFCSLVHRPIDPLPNQRIFKSLQPTKLEEEPSAFANGNVAFFGTLASRQQIVLCEFYANFSSEEEERSKFVEESENVIDI
jgi:hypothetical protein